MLTDQQLLAQKQAKVDVLQRTSEQSRASKFVSQYSSHNQWFDPSEVEAVNMSGWRLVVEIFLPIPLILLLFLSLPFPKFFRRTVLRLTHNVLSLPLLGSLQLGHAMLIITGVSLAVMTNSTLLTNRFNPPADQALTANQKQQFLGQKWRNERNFWISALSFMSWWGLFCFYKATHKRVELEEGNQQLMNRLSAFESFQTPDIPQNGEESEVTQESKKDT